MAEKSVVFKSNTSFTRPANTTAYATGDVITDSTSASTILEFTNAGDQNSQFIELSNVVLTTSKSAGAPGLNLWLFDTEPAVPNDNAAMTLTDAENNTVVAVIPLSNKYTATLNGIVNGGDLTTMVRLGASESLYGILVATGAYTPISEEVFDITIIGKRHG